MGIYMAARSIVRLVSRRFSTASKVVPKGDVVAEKFPAEKRNHVWEAFERRRLEGIFEKDDRMVDFGVKLTGLVVVVLAWAKTADIRQAEAKALVEKTLENVAAEKRQDAEAMGEKTPDNVA